ncbi:MAG: hypothetical protein AB7E79_14915 [Rhodospirillaceae bacterium]
MAILWSVYAVAADDPRALVEIGPAPDDPVTNRLKEAITDAFKTSDQLRLSTGLQPGTLVVSIPNPVEARAHMGRTEYLYRVEFRAANGRLFERGFGSCWSDELRVCVFNVVRTANRIAPRL